MVGRGVSFKNQVADEIKTLFELAQGNSSQTFSFEQIEDLPEPVKRYFRFALTEGYNYISLISIKHDGLFRLKETHRWSPIEGEEYYTVNPPAFPKAKFYVQKREFDFCVKNPLSQRKPIAVLFDPMASKIMGGMAGSDRLVIVDGDYNLAPGVDLFLAPGHTLGLQVVRVNTAKGPAVVGSELCTRLPGVTRRTIRVASSWICRHGYKLSTR